MVYLKNLLSRFRCKITSPPKISVVMLTIDRSPKGNHLPQTIQSLKDSGLFEHPNFNFTLTHSGEQESNISEALVVHPELNIIKSEQLIPYNKAVAQAIETGLESNPGTVIFMEDDTKVCENFPQFATDAINAVGKSNPLIDFTTYYKEITDAYFEGKQFINMQAKSFYGIQCLAMRKSAAVSLSKYIKKHHSIKAGFCDTWIESWQLEEKLKPIITCAVPSGVQHTGNNSTFDHHFPQVPCFKDDDEKTIPKKTGDFELSLFSDSSGNDPTYVFKNILGSRALNLNKTAYLIYLFCDGKLNLKQIILEIHNEMGGNKHSIDAEIRKALFLLKNKGLITY
jgi:hypothetical protein